MDYGLLQIANGDFQSEDSFTDNIIRTIPVDSNKVICEVPFWANEYTWRMISSPNSSEDFKTELYHFSTATIPEIETGKMRLRIIKAANNYKKAFVFLDNNRTLYDIQGNPVWFLPDKVFKDLVPMRTMPELRDLKLSCKGTITYLLNSQAYEINYNGDILWKAPNTGEVGGDNTERYHHEFTRLSSGHYMVLGQERGVLWPPVNNNNRNRSSFGTIIEYDEKGNVIWSWKSSSYLSKSDLLYYHSNSDSSNRLLYLHENSFYFDEKNQTIYLSCRDISRIIKIKYPEGNVLNSYGKSYQPGLSSQKGQDLFCKQHSISKSEKGYLYLYNNNVCTSGAAPEVLIMKENARIPGGIRKVWEYACRFDQDFSKTDKTIGGNVIKLPDSTLFVSMGGEYSRIFIVNRKKEILWSALPEIWNVSAKKWQAREQYRASIIVDPKELEKLIWTQ